jgi:hypothetical protein
MAEVNENPSMDEKEFQSIVQAVTEKIRRPKGTRGNHSKAKGELDELELMLLLFGGLAKLPKPEDSALFVNTQDLAGILSYTPQRISQLYWGEGLPKARGKTYYLPDVVNWLKVKIIATALSLKPRELANFGLVDFTLGSSSVPEIDPKVLASMPSLAGPQKSERVKHDGKAKK